MPPLVSRRRATAGLLALPLAALAAPAATASATPAHAASRGVSAPSKPVVTKVTGGSYARVDFRVAREGGQRWSKIEARGVQVEDGEQVGSCHPPVIRSKGTWVGFSPGGPGDWSFQVRVRNAGGWSPWSKASELVTVG